MRAFTLILVLLSTLIPATSEAARQALDPKLRVHMGITAADGAGSIGGTFGVEARASRYIFLDLGGFYTPGDPSGAEQSLASTTHAPMHGIYAMPGIRLPHVQPTAFSWDITARVGPGMLWSAYLGETLNAEDNFGVFEADVMIASSLDIAIRRGQYGVRASGRVFAAWPYNFESRTDPAVIMPQVAIEIFSQY